MAEQIKFPFKMYTSSGEGLLATGHHTKSMEIIEVTSGTVKLCIGTEEAYATLGDFVYVPPTLVYRISAIEGEASIRSLVFNLSVIESSMENFDNEIFYMFYIQSRNKISTFTVGHPVYECIKACMHESYDEYISKDVCYKLPIRANIYRMMTVLLRYYGGSRDEADRVVYHNVMRLRPVVNYIDEHMGEKIYIETLADMITVSPDYFTKMFKESIGKTPIDYINGVRVNRALALLSETDISVNDISDSLGFSNPNYFHKIFKQYIDTSPLAYRKSCAAAHK